MLKNFAREEGSSLFEYAIIFILFMTMLLGIGNFGHALYVYHFLSHEAREATRWAAVNGATCADDAGEGSNASCNGTGGMNSGPATDTDIENYVKSHVPSGIDAGKIKVNQNGDGSSVPFWPATGGCATTDSAGKPIPTKAPGCPVQVRVSYDLSFILPLVPVGPLKLSSTSQMVIAH